MIGTLQQSAGAASQSIMLCRPINPISAMMLQLWQMWTLGESVRKRNPQANLLQQQHFKQMPWSTFPLLLQKVRSWILVFLFNLNADHTSVSWLRCLWTSIWRRRKFSTHTSFSITHHPGMTLLTQRVFKLSHDPESGIISFWFHHIQHSPLAPRKPRTSSPLTQVWFQSPLANTFCRFWQSSFSLPTMRYLNYLASQILQSQVLHCNPLFLLAPI